MRCRTEAFAALPTGCGASSPRIRWSVSAALTAENWSGGASCGRGAGGRNPASDKAKITARTIALSKSWRSPGQVCGSNRPSCVRHARVRPRASQSAIQMWLRLAAYSSESCGAGRICGRLFHAHSEQTCTLRPKLALHPFFSVLWLWPVSADPIAPGGGATSHRPSQRFCLGTSLN